MDIKAVAKQCEYLFLFNKIVNDVKSFISNLKMKKHKVEHIKAKATSPERRAPDPKTKLEMQKNFKELIIYILGDAYEKAEEVDIKTDEDFKMLKQGFFKEVKVKIDEEYDKKTRRYNLDQEIGESQANQKINLGVLFQRQEVIEIVKDEIVTRLKRDLSNSERYTNILYLLIMEGLFMLLEMIVYIRCRKSDISIVASLIPHCKETYENTSKKKVNIFIDNTKNLPDDSIGGIELTTKGERIFIQNTLEKRLDQIMLKSIPAINVHLFEQNIHNLHL